MFLVTHGEGSPSTQFDSRHLADGDGGLNSDQTRAIDTGNVSQRNKLSIILKEVDARSYWLHHRAVSIKDQLDNNGETEWLPPSLGPEVSYKARANLRMSSQKPYNHLSIQARVHTLLQNSRETPRQSDLGLLDKREYPKRRDFAKTSQDFWTMSASIMG